MREQSQAVAGRRVDDVAAWWARAVEAMLEIIHPIQLMFWGDRYGTLNDTFGVGGSLASTPA